MSRNRQRRPAVGGVVTVGPTRQDRLRAARQMTQVMAEIARKQIILPTLKDVVDVGSSKERDGN